MNQKSMNGQENKSFEEFVYLSEALAHANGD